MAHVGIDHPGILDLVTQSDTEVRLVLIEERALAPEDAQALQEKMNNYLAYAVDGELNSQYPESHGKAVTIRVDLYSAPAQFVVQFLRQYSEAVAQYNVNIELAVNGTLVP